MKLEEAIKIVKNYIEWRKMGEFGKFLEAIKLVTSIAERVNEEKTPCMWRLSCKVKEDSKCINCPDYEESSSNR